MKNVAIIMRSKNEQPYPRPALEALFGQTEQDFCLYNVDSGSTDGTLEVVREFNPERVVEIPPKAYIPGKVLNDMIARTAEPIVVFLNADAIPLHPEWLERLLRPVREGRADGTMSVQYARPSANWIVKYDYERAYDPRNIKAGNEDFFSAVACAFRRELWEQQKFPEQGYAEDLAWAKLCREQGARFLLVEDSRVEHSHDYTIQELYRKKFRHGVTFANLYGRGPQFWKQTGACVKELARDFLHALAKFKWGTIPYNVVYRITIHVALHRGLAEGAAKRKSGGG